MSDMSENTRKAMTETGESMASGVQHATSTAQDMGRQMMEKGMAGMQELSKLFADMKMPGMGGMGGGMSGGMDAFLQMQRRNMEVLSAANRVALEGAQTVAKRHMEIMQQTMSEMTESMREMASPDSPQVKAAKQAELLKASYERAVAHIRELADLIQRANGEAVEMLNRRFTEALDEVKKLAAQGAATGGTSV